MNPRMTALLILSLLLTTGCGEEKKLANAQHQEMDAEKPLTYTITIQRPSHLNKEDEEQIQALCELFQNLVNQSLALEQLENPNGRKPQEGENSHLKLLFWELFKIKAQNDNKAWESQNEPYTSLKIYAEVQPLPEPQADTEEEK